MLPRRGRGVGRVIHAVLRGALRRHWPTSALALGLGAVPLALGLSAFVVVSSSAPQPGELSWRQLAGYAVEVTLPADSSVVPGSVVKDIESVPGGSAVVTSSARLLLRGDGISASLPTEVGALGRDRLSVRSAVVQGSWPVRPGEIAVSAAARKSTGWQVGTRLRAADGSTAAVVGVYRPRNDFAEKSAFLHAAPTPSSSSSEFHIYADLPEGASAQMVERWRAAGLSVHGQLAQGQDHVAEAGVAPPWVTPLGWLLVLAAWLIVVVTLVASSRQLEADLVALGKLGVPVRGRARVIALLGGISGAGAVVVALPAAIVLSGSSRARLEEWAGREWFAVRLPQGTGWAAAVGTVAIPTAALLIWAIRRLRRAEVDHQAPMAGNRLGPRASVLALVSGITVGVLGLASGKSYAGLVAATLLAPAVAILATSVVRWLASRSATSFLVPLLVRNALVRRPRVLGGSAAVIAVFAVMPLTFAASILAVITAPPRGGTSTAAPVSAVPRPSTAAYVGDAPLDITAAQNVAQQAGGSAWPWWAVGIPAADGSGSRPVLAAGARSCLGGEPAKLSANACRLALRGVAAMNEQGMATLLGRSLSSDERRILDRGGALVLSDELLSTRGPSTVGVDDIGSLLSQDGSGAAPVPLVAALAVPADGTMTSDALPGVLILHSGSMPDRLRPTGHNPTGYLFDFHHPVSSQTEQELRRGICAAAENFGDTDYLVTIESGNKTGIVKVIRNSGWIAVALALLGVLTLSWGLRRDLLREILVLQRLGAGRRRLAIWSGCLAAISGTSGILAAIMTAVAGAEYFLFVEQVTSTPRMWVMLVLPLLVVPTLAAISGTWVTRPCDEAIPGVRE